MRRGPAVFVLAWALVLSGCSRSSAPDVEVLPAFGQDVYVDEMPEPITRVIPTYPDAARAAGVQGTVMVQALVDRKGLVRDTRVVLSVPMLDDAAVEAVKQWIFRPALANGAPVAVWVAIPVHFSLH